MLRAGRLWSLAIWEMVVSVVNSAVLVLVLFTNTINTCSADLAISINADCRFAS